MNLDSRQLLRRLEPAVRPAGIVSPAGRNSIATADFDELLSRAAEGEFASGRSIDQDALEAPVEERFAERLAGIADAAEVAGYERVLVIAEDRPLLLEVSGRRIDGELATDDASDSSLLAVDAAVRIGGTPESDRTTATGPVATSLPTGIVEALERGSTGPESESPSIKRDDAA